MLRWAHYRQIEGDLLKRLLKIAAEGLLVEQLLVEQTEAGQIRKVDSAS